MKNLGCFALLCMLILGQPNLHASEEDAPTLQPHNEPLSIHVTLSSNVYRIQEEVLKEKEGTGHYLGRDFFSAECLITNQTEDIQEYWMYTCSYFLNWTTNHEFVAVRPWGCRKNFLAPIFLQPGESQTYTIPLHVFEGIPDEIATFRLGFQPEVPSAEAVELWNASNAVTKGDVPRSDGPLTGIFWSDQIEIKVVPE